MTYRIAKTASIVFILLAIAMSAINAYRDATMLRNPTGLAVNAMLIIFLLAGIVFIIRDRPTPKPPKIP